MQVDIDYVIEIAVEDAEIIKRMGGRRVHSASGRTYHVEFNKPQRDGMDDLTGEPLIQRDDDKEEIVKKRLAVYHEQTKPLVDFYSADDKPGIFNSIAGVGAVSAITAKVLAVLG